MIMIDIEMPEKCGSCPCFHAEFPMYCKLIKPPDKDKRIVAPYGLPRPEWCPLKEQEAVKPIKMQRMDSNFSFFVPYFLCGNCRYELEGKDVMFCAHCGRPVKWDD